MDLLQVLLLFLSAQLNLLLFHSQILGCVLELLLLLFDLGLKLLDIFIILLHRMLKLHIARFFLKLNVCLKVLNALLDRIQVLLLDEDLTVKDVCLRQLRLCLHGEAG